MGFGFINFFARSNQMSNENELPEIFPLAVLKKDFVKLDVLSTYQKILTDVVERTSGITEDIEALLWDNCLQNEASEGLITLVASAMTDRRDLFLVYLPAVGVLRKATNEEERKIRQDYKERGESDTGIFVSFNRYRRTERLMIYSEFEYCLLASMNKSLNISKALQIKINNLRSSVALPDSEVAIAQGKNISNALGKGSDVLLDKEDEVATASPDTSAIEKSIGFNDNKKADILGMPVSYVTGVQTAGMGSTGEQDTRAVERGLKAYFVSIMRPILENLFDIEVTFKSQDFRNISTALEVLKTFDMTSDDYLSQESKQIIAAQMFDLNPEEEKSLIEAQPVPTPPQLPPSTPAVVEEA